ncbi:MAG: RHS repeat-associated core domain-containing protein, partial [Polyangiales bacterium]
AEVDPLGNATRWAYDPRGRTVETELPDGAKERVAYDAAGDVVAVEDAGGSRWVYERDDAGRLITLLDPVGRRTRYHHGRGGVTRAELPDGRTLRLTYDARLNLTAAGCDGAPTVTARFDRLGRLVERASGGRVESFALDPLGRIVAARGADGEDVAVERDPEGGVTALRDRRGTTRYGYTAFRRLAFEARPHGTVSLRYNTENELVAVENAAGEVHAFERDARGLVVAEVGFDGAVRRYAHDAARRVASARAPGGATTAYSHDARGRLVEARYGDGRAERFVWSPAGALMEAHSADAAVRWERDALGRVVRELQGDVAVESRWGAGARRSAVASSLGARMAIERDGAGDVRAVLAGGGAWRAEFERDERGLERARRFTGGVVATWARDALGRPVEQHVTTPAGPAGSVGFAWSGLERVDARVDAVHGRTIYERDAAGRPARARADDGTSQVRAFDAAGNVYRTEDGSDRAYAPGGAPVRAEGAAWAHDADGNLTERVDPDGARWRYGWGADGRLREVLRPDGVRVEFAYDALGRRTEKRVDGRATRWVWDGDVVLHELEEGAPTRTWYFEPESFVPLALDDGGRWCGAVPDVVGAPSALFDAAGDVAWRAQLDLYGAARADVAEVRCPWRWPGQYEDEETGLYYNRHRYYSPALGAYVSRDPLGLAAGVNARAYVPDPLTACDPLGLIVLQQVPYDGHPLFNAVREYVASRPASELRGRNVAAFQMDDGSIHVRSSQGGGVHSESVLLNEFDHSRVTAVYSERIPCTGRTNCRGALDSALGAEVPVYWTHDMVRGQEGATAKAIEKDRNTFCRS